MKKLIVGPILKDLEKTGLTGNRILIATAYYTPGPLGKLLLYANSVTFAVRMDCNDLADWISGAIDPPALLQSIEQLNKNGSEVKLYVGKNAHAKMYIGERSALIGSANLTARGFSGIGNEVMWKIPLDRAARKDLDAGAKQYLNGMENITIDELKTFVNNNQKKVQALKESAQKSRESQPEKITNSQRPHRLGNYEKFLDWLVRQRTSAAEEILARANGKGNLSGHIYRNFYGIRQYLIYSPKEHSRFRHISEDDYKLSKDVNTEIDFARFVKNYAVDEDDFTLEIWKTYLPIECGGRATKHGGTIGNLNRMLPLVARYLSRV